MFVINHGFKLKKTKKTKKNKKKNNFKLVVVTLFSENVYMIYMLHLLGDMTKDNTICREQGVSFYA